MNRKIAENEGLLTANAALLTVDSISEAERIAIRSQITADTQRIAADTQRLTALEGRLELRLQQQSSE